MTRRATDLATLCRSHRALKSQAREADQLVRALDKRITIAMARRDELYAQAAELQVSIEALMETMARAKAERQRRKENRHVHIQPARS